MDFPALIQAIRTTHDHFATQAVRAVNVGLTLRNWIIGYHIAEFELHGADRASYGDRLLDEVARALGQLGIANTGRRQLYQYLAFYRTYPQIARAVPAQSRPLLGPRTESGPIVPTASAQLAASLGHVSDGEPIVPTASAQFGLPIESLLSRLSYSHFRLLVGVGDDLQRAFYEAECVRGQWSVRELERQIATLLFERTGLSTDKARLMELVRRGAEADTPALALRDPYVFEFLGIKPRELMSESALEDALLDRLQEFLLELGRGFCFEFRQKRILIGDEFCFIGLVFYHRILKCHVLVELKIDRFRHEYLGGLNTYVSWYRQNEMTPGDNPPIGMLLCTQHDQALVQYALAGMDNQLFVTRYQLELPHKEEIQRFLEEQIREVAGPAAPGDTKEHPQ